MAYRWMTTSLSASDVCSSRTLRLASESCAHADDNVGGQVCSEWTDAEHTLLRLLLYCALLSAGHSW